MTDYDVAALRSHFPALQEGAAHFDGPGGSQTPDVVADAVAGVLRSAVSNRGLLTRSERRADGVVLACREAMGDFLGTEPEGVVFGRSMTQITYDVARALAKTWGPGDEVVVTRLDHDGNIRPWVHAAEAAGATVRWAGFDSATGVLDVADIEAVLSERTRLVACTAASNLIGTRPPVRAITDAAHAAGALAYVDGVHYSAHAFVDLASLGADFYVCSPYKFLGPHCGILAAGPTLLEQVHPDRLLPQSDDVPERFELGTLPYELMAGVTAAVDFLAGIVRGPGGRRERLRRSMAAVEDHETALRRRIEAAVAELPGARQVGRAPERTPTLLFDFPGRSNDDVAQALAAADVNAPAGEFYALEPSRWLGLGDTGGLRVGLAPYTDDEDVDRLLAALGAVLSQPGGTTQG
ncbi:MAG: cysteine desulfurase-like protein [Acidimicrobiales bacterium]